MRVATSSMYDATIADLQARQKALSDAQRAMTDGKRIHVTSDDPAGAARAERAHVDELRLDAEARATAASRRSLTLGEATLGQAGELLQQARETLISAGDGSYGATERSALVQQLKALRAQLVSLANREDGAGGHVFGGQSGTVVPFVDGTAGFAAAGTGGQMQVASREEMPLALDGPRIWLGAASGNGVFETDAAPTNTGQGWIAPGSVVDPSLLTGATYEVTFGGTPAAPTFTVTADGAPTAFSGAAYTSGAAIALDGLTFTISGKPAPGDTFRAAPSTPGLGPIGALDRAIGALSDASAGAGRVQQAVSFGLRDVDAVMTHFQAARAAAGATLQRLDTIDQRNVDRKLWATNIAAETENGDMVKLISDFQAQQTGYQSALQSYAMVQRMSLLDYVK